MNTQSNGKPQEPGAAGMLRTEVARRAYEIWEREGRPHGRDRDHWLAAEREIAREAGVGKTTAAAGAAKPKRPRARKPAAPGL